MDNQHLIEISGPDYVGKSTQAELLTYATGRFAHNFGGYGGYSDKLPSQLSADEDFAWWFRDTNLPQLGNALIGAYHNRARVALASPHELKVVERGATMVRAQLAANFATRREVDITEVVDEVDALVVPRLGTVPASARTEFYLSEQPAWTAQTHKLRQHGRQFKPDGNGYSEAQNAFYAQYMHNVRSALAHYHAQGTGMMQHVAVDRSAVDVQNLIRSNSALTSLHLPILLNHPHHYVGLAGMSESGKSSLAANLAALHGFARFKLGFFNEATRQDTAYGKPSAIALRIAHFLVTNRFIQRASFESFHDPRLSAELKLLLGDHWTTVYLETPADTRQARLLAESPHIDPRVLLAEQGAKDARKSFHGTPGHATIADIIIQNTGSPEEATARLVDHLKLQGE